MKWGDVTPDQEIDDFKYVILKEKILAITTIKAKVKVLRDLMGVLVNYDAIHQCFKLKNNYRLATLLYYELLPDADERLPEYMNTSLVSFSEALLKKMIKSDVTYEDLNETFLYVPSIRLEIDNIDSIVAINKICESSELNFKIDLFQCYSDTVRHFAVNACKLEVTTTGILATKSGAIAMLLLANRHRLSPDIRYPQWDGILENMLETTRNMCYSILERESTEMITSMVIYKKLQNERQET